MTIPNQPEVFRKAWQAEINELAKLGYSLPLENLDQLKQIRKQLTELVEVAINHTYINGGIK